MDERSTITKASLDALFDALARDGKRILGPTVKHGRVEIAEIRKAEDLAVDHLQAVGSAKGTVFPKVEKILGHTVTGKDIALEDPEPTAKPTVVIGIRPCEARAMRPLDAVFNWDSRDKFFNARLANTTLVSIACTQADSSCFCTSLGGAPDSPEGSDIMLRPLKSGGYVVEVVSDKGKAIVALAGSKWKAAADDADVAPVAKLEKAFDQAALAASLAKKFDDTRWADQSLRCLGCGACAYVCPTCVCFDLHDEASPEGGRRLRTWDSCGLRPFTLHASGHNPRDQQSQRWRQRVYHKFSYYPELFKMAGCVGCGKCSRACPVDMNLKEHLVSALEGTP